MKEISIIVRNSFSELKDYDFILDEYKNITQKDYNFDTKDEIMIQLLEKYELIPNQFQIIKINENLIKHTRIVSYANYEEVTINYESYKIERLKRLLSSEEEDQDLILKINEIVFERNFS